MEELIRTQFYLLEWILNGLTYHVVDSKSSEYDEHAKKAMQKIKDLGYTNTGTIYRGLNVNTSSGTYKILLRQNSEYIDIHEFVTELFSYKDTNDEIDALYNNPSIGDMYDTIISEKEVVALLYEDRTIIDSVYGIEHNSRIIKRVNISQEAEDIIYDTIFSYANKKMYSFSKDRDAAFWFIY